jgi:hypothetical protein
MAKPASFLSQFIEFVGQALPAVPSVRLVPTPERGYRSRTMDQGTPLHGPWAQFSGILALTRADLAP